MAYNDLSTTVVVIMAICSAVILINNTIKATKELNKPQADLKKLSDKNAEDIKAHKERLDALEDNAKMQTKTLLAIVNHEISGNDINGLKAVKKEMEDYLINK